MTILGITDSIRQRHPGRFNRSGDGKEPYAHVNGQKLVSREDQIKSAVYANNKRVQVLEKGLGRDPPRLFDSEVGLKIQSEKRSEAGKEEKLDQQYGNTGKPKKSATQTEGSVDQWV